MTTYDELLTKIQHLTPVDQLRLLEELAGLLRQAMEGQRTHSILELQGLGKELWQGIDAQTYVNQERAAWSG